MELCVKVIDIKGLCPVYRLGSSFTLKQGYILETSESDPVCMHSLASLLPYYIALSRGVSAVDLGLSKGDSEEAYLQCLDPCEITGGGTVYFRVSRII